MCPMIRPTTLITNTQPRLEVPSTNSCTTALRAFTFSPRSLKPWSASICIPATLSDGWPSPQWEPNTETTWKDRQVMGEHHGTPHASRTFHFQLAHHMVGIHRLLGGVNMELLEPPASKKYCNQHNQTSKPEMSPKHLQNQTKQSPKHLSIVA